MGLVEWRNYVVVGILGGVTYATITEGEKQGSPLWWAARGGAEMYWIRELIMFVYLTRAASVYSVPYRTSSLSRVSPSPVNNSMLF